MNVALAYNVVKPEMLLQGPLDRTAEFDSEETIHAVVAALESGGHQVVLIEADESVAEKLKSARPDIVFNIAEGIRGASRESHVPVICEMLGIPYTGSDPLALCTCLDKARTKQVLAYHHIPTAKFQVIRSTQERTSLHLTFPLIVKLLAEGSSMGLSRNSVVDTEVQAREQIARLMSTYGQPVIIEEFIQGREFTVGVLGNDSPIVLPITEIVFERPRGITLFEFDDWVETYVRQARGEGLVFPRAEHRSVCPAEIDPELAERIRARAVEAYGALGCRDWCRLEVRHGPDDELYVIELNPIAGIDPTYWLAKAAYAAGWSYTGLVNRILDYAIQRTMSASVVTNATGEMRQSR